jgi:hypothetical protein
MAHLPPPTAAFIPPSLTFIPYTLAMVFAYAAVSAAQKPRHPLRGPGMVHSQGGTCIRSIAAKSAVTPIAAEPPGGGFSPDGGGPGGYQGGPQRPRTRY